MSRGPVSYTHLDVYKRQGKVAVLKIFADIKDKKHPLINAVVSEMVPSICTENNQILSLIHISGGQGSLDSG